MQKKFNIIVEEGEDGYLISTVVELPGFHTQLKIIMNCLKELKKQLNNIIKKK
jgi:predicted RNase H-like HicB family nuclease